MHKPQCIMKHKIFLFFALLFCTIMHSQTVAYDATYDNFDNTDCIDLFYLNPFVKGHQIDVQVSYYSSLLDAQNDTNPLVRFYTYSSNNETLYARVTNTLNATYDTSVITLALREFPVPPPPNGQLEFYLCDVDNDGIEVVHLRNIGTTGGNIYNNQFCGLYDSQISLTYHLSYSDVVNGENPIGEVFTLTEDTYIYCRISNDVNSGTFTYDYILKLTTCAASDDDGDGIDNAREDANRNGNYLDDDTDIDGLKNYEDDDDDGDGILTINEDYNNNGSALDDDTNSNGIADYLEADVTLSTAIHNDIKFGIYPNPVTNYLNIETDISVEASVVIFDLNGRIVMDLNGFKAEENIDVTKLPTGVYFLKLYTETINNTIKFIKK
ncbi:T9SS type A sorting domain-containing protein [Lacinutrix sp. WUR7]|nr:T9SS type A sorting domain-containing protein [Lacinutrix sp. WUR7]